MSGRAYSAVSFHLGSDSRVECLTYPESGPILCVDSAGLHVTLHVNRHRGVSSVDVDNARALVEAAHTYLGECERLRDASNSAPAESTESAENAAA